MSFRSRGITHWSDCLFILGGILLIAGMANENLFIGVIGIFMLVCFGIIFSYLLIYKSGKKKKTRTKRPTEVKAKKVIDGLGLSQYLELATKCSERGEHQKSIACWRKIVELRPNYVTGWIMMGQEHEKIKNDDKALECYEHVLKIDPSNQDAKWYKMNLLND